jgi:hypothetical protein
MFIFDKKKVSGNDAELVFWAGGVTVFGQLKIPGLEGINGAEISCKESSRYEESTPFSQVY